ncbi:MAG: hypothetical protein AAB036_00700 [Elusimicrobiota bacterium]
MRPILAALLLMLPLAAQSARPSAAPRAREEGGSLLSGSLIEALAAIRKPELGGVFSYIGEVNAPRAFADLLARDPKSLKKYLSKLMDDIDASGGAAAWDHEVCAMLVTYYAGPEISGLKRPDAKRMKQLNATVLSPVKTIEEIAARRKS